MRKRSWIEDELADQRLPFAMMDAQRRSARKVARDVMLVVLRQQLSSGSLTLDLSIFTNGIPASRLTRNAFVQANGLGYNAPNRGAAAMCPYTLLVCYASVGEFVEVKPCRTLVSRRPLDSLGRSD